MTLCVMPYRVEDERFTEEHLDLMIPPALRREGLQEHDYALIHVYQRHVMHKTRKVKHLEIHLA